MRHFPRSQGFTIIELFLVIGILVLVGALTLPVGFAFYQTQVSRETGADVLGLLRRAQTDAMYGADDRSAGVKFLPTTMVLYHGESYALRAPTLDLVLPIPSGTRIAGLPDDVHFSKGSGVGNASGTLAVVLYGRTTFVEVSYRGAMGIR